MMVDVTEEIERLAGQVPRSFATFANEHESALRNE